MNRLVELTFKNRGYSSEFLREMECAEHEDLKDIDRLAVRLKEIHDEGRHITVIPDFDMDGISAGTVAYAGLSELGFDVSLFIPDPSKGYGFNEDTIKELLKKHPRTQTILTCDTGISCYEGINYCKDRGIEILVTDHHIQEAVSEADIIVDPCRMDDGYEHKGICGAFVIQLVLQFYADTFCDTHMRDQMQRLRLFAGIGTVSDIMPVLYENRQLIRDSIGLARAVYSNGTVHGVRNFEGCTAYKTPFWGMFAVLKVCAEHGIIKKEDDINEEFYGFYLAPMFNSVKRMDGDLRRAFLVFFGNEREENAEYLYQLNELRKKTVEEEMENLLSSVQPYAPFIYISKAKPGILGLLATRLVERNKMPVFVMNDMTGRMKGPFCGSGRSPEWYPCFSRQIGRFDIAGHECAFGCRLSDNSALVETFRFLKEDVPAMLANADIKEAVPDFIISTDWKADTGIDIALFDEYLSEMENYHPFGKGFPQPDVVFRFNDSDAVYGWKSLGMDKQHLKIGFASGFDLYLWNQGDKISLKDNGEMHEARGKLFISEYAGKRGICFKGVLAR